MTAPTLDSFFSGGGGKSVSWKNAPIGTTVTGVIKAVHPPAQQTDPADGKLVFKKDGSPKMSVRIDLATNERDPQDPEDDGSRGLYVQGWMQGAVGDALRKAGRQGPPEVGGTLSVTLSERQANDNPALNPINKFTAWYQSPATAATGQFFDQGAQQQYAQQPPVQQGYQQPPVQPGPPPQQYAQQTPPQQQYAPPVQQQAPQGQVPGINQLMAPPPQQAPAPQGSPAPAGFEPQKPDSITDAAWAQMDVSTRSAVAATFAAGVPF